MAGTTSNEDKGSEKRPTTDYIEYTGEEPHGVAFLSSHTILRSDPMWKRNGVEVNKDITWERDPATAKPIGQKGTRLLVRVEDLPAGAADVLEKANGFKRVSE